GAVYLYGPNGNLISTLTGSSAGDKVGNGMVKSLGNGYFVVTSPEWNGTYGAATRVNGTTGLSGTVSASNSLVGTDAGNYVGSEGVVVVGGSNYVVVSGGWDGGGSLEVGAVTWCSGATGCTGPVTTANSLH